MTGSVGRLASDLAVRASGLDRFIVAIAGPPGAGKSTFAKALVEALDAAEPGSAVLMPMDGYHYDNMLLDARGLRSRKGAPETFDVEGMISDLGRIGRGEEAVAVPVFDRTLDLSRGSARIVERRHRIVVVEGNYLLLGEEPWRRTRALIDRSVLLKVDEGELRRRLVGRWLDHGLAERDAVARAEGNDLPNARLVISSSVEPDEAMVFDVDAGDWIFEPGRASPS